VALETGDLDTSSDLKLIVYIFASCFFLHFEMMKMR
jgi:hypothetical protein